MPLRGPLDPLDPLDSLLPADRATALAGGALSGAKSDSI